jgi:C-terminal processing protease CtpA/Prc
MIWLLALACRPPVPEATDSDPIDTGPEGPASADWCDRVVAGSADVRAPALALSDLHARVRLFGPEDDFLTADAALAAAIRGGSVSDPDLDAYASGLLAACAVPIEDAELGTAEVELRGTQAWVRPGDGLITIPGEATAVVLDLRRLQAAPGLDQALTAALSASLGSDLDGPVEQVREWEGYVDQVFSATNAYSVEHVEVGGEPISATGTDRPLVVVTGRRMPPEAARLAGTLAQSGRAWIVGQDVLAAVAESRFGAVGAEGLAFKAADLIGPDGEPWPDVLAADVLTDDADAELAAADLSTWAAPEPGTGAVERALLEDRTPFREEPPAEADAADLAASLLVVHGAARTFFRYFPIVGEGVDERLTEVLAAPLDPSDPAGFRETLGRVGEALHDGHVFYGGSALPAYTYVPVVLDQVDGWPVVANTSMPGLLPGDAIVAVDGTPIADLYADWRLWHGAATEGYTLDLMSRELLRLSAPATWRVRDPDGNERDVVVDPAEGDASTFSYVAIERPNGRLDDLGASDVAYVNLDSAVTTSNTELTAALTAAEGASGLILDMRGYPGIDHYAVVQRLLSTDAFSPVFRTNAVQPDGTSVVEEQYELPPKTNPSWSGPVVLLVGPVTVSAAENFSMMLPPDRLTAIVGRQSAGTNGNITGLQLTGGYWFTFTGMEVLFPDGSDFHGTGIVPTIEVAPTAADWRDGKDPVLEAAITALRGP